MDIIFPQRIVFFHIMKTAGTTLTAFLDQHYPLQAICPARHWYTLEQHITEDIQQYSLFRGHFNWGQLSNIPESPFIITLIRNPLERLLSEYQHWRRAPRAFIQANPQYTQIYTLAQTSSLQEFVSRASECDIPINNRQTYQLGAEFCFPMQQATSQPQLTPQQILSHAIQNLSSVGLAGATDQLQPFLDILCYVNGWMPPAEIPVLRKSSQPAPSEITESILASLEESNSLDVTLYQAAKQRLQEQYQQYFDGNEHTDRENIRRILQQRYRTAYQQRHPTPRHYVNFHFDQALDGDGWHERQTQGSQTWRWTGPAPLSVIDFPFSITKDAEITIHIVREAAPGLLSQMQVKVNEVVLPYRLQENADGHTACLVRVPSLVLRRSLLPLRLAISLGETCPIQEKYSPSTVLAGLGISQISIYPLPSEENSVKEKFLSVFQKQAASQEPMTLFHVTHWKAGSQWVHKILRESFPNQIVAPTLGNTQFIGQKIPAGKVYPTVYVTQKEFHTAKLPPRWHRFIIIRDLRDTLISGYFSIKFSHPPMGIIAEWRQVLQNLSMEDGLLFLMKSWLPDSVAIQKSWLAAGETLWHYEDLLQDDIAILMEILLGQAKMDISAERLEQIIVQSRFENVSGGRKLGEENLSVHERKGAAGDWKNYFTAPVTQAFKDQFNGLLVQTGYEKDTNW